MPRRFEGGAGGQAPLRLQVSTTSSGAGSVAIVVGYRATGDNSSGSASRPVLSRPSTIGTGTSASADLRSVPSGASPSCVFLTTYSSPPSVPVVTEGTFNLPMRISWFSNTEDGIVVGGQGTSAALLLYATATSGHTWTGALSWEEP